MPSYHDILSDKKMQLKLFSQPTNLSSMKTIGPLIFLQETQSLMLWGLPNQSCALTDSSEFYEVGFWGFYRFYAGFINQTVFH